MYSADDALQAQIDGLAAQTLVITHKEMYIKIPSGDQSSYTITCPTDEIAQSGGIVKMTTQIGYIDIYANHMDGTNGWYFQAANSHPSDEFDVKLYVYCLKLG